MLNRLPFRSLTFGGELFHKTCAIVRRGLTFRKQTPRTVLVSSFAGIGYCRLSSLVVAPRRNKTPLGNDLVGKYRQKIGLWIAKLSSARIKRTIRGVDFVPLAGIAAALALCSEDIAGPAAQVFRGTSSRADIA